MRVREGGAANHPSARVGECVSSQHTLVGEGERELCSCKIPDASEAWNATRMTGTKEDIDVYKHTHTHKDTDIDTQHAALTAFASLTTSFSWMSMRLRRCFSCVRQHEHC